MPEREKVIKGLEHELRNRGKCGHYCREGIETFSCEYDKDGFCIQHWGKDALSLLKAQEPRVLDWNEIGTVDGAVWLEDRDKSEVVPGLVMQMYSAVNLDIKKDGKLHTASASRSDYGERWRCWTSRPTDEQREAIPWSD